MYRTNNETSVLLSDGRRLHFVRGAHESVDEFNGRVLCRIEEAITNRRGPAPAGTRWAEWTHHGHLLRRYSTHGLGYVVESTGNPYADRTRFLPGLVSEDSARVVLGLDY